jgi:hypothetical protein
MNLQQIKLKDKMHVMEFQYLLPKPSTIQLTILKNDCLQSCQLEILYPLSPVSRMTDNIATTTQRTIIHSIHCSFIQKNERPSEERHPEWLCHNSRDDITAMTCTVPICIQKHFIGKCMRIIACWDGPKWIRKRYSGMFIMTGAGPSV